MSPREERTAIFWDLDGEAIPPIGMGIGDACEALRHCGHEYGRVIEFKAYISPASDTELSQSTRLASDLRQNGVSLSLHHPNNGSPTASAGPKELVMLSDLLVYVMDYGPGGSMTIVLVTNDYGTFGYPLSLLRNRNCHVVVLSTREVLGQPRYVRRLDAIWNHRGDREIQAPPPRPLSPRLPQTSRVIQSPQNRLRSQSRSFSQSHMPGFPALLRGTPQIAPVAVAVASPHQYTSPRHHLANRSGSISFTSEDAIPPMNLKSPSMKGFSLSSPSNSPPKLDIITNHAVVRAQPQTQHAPQHQHQPQYQPQTQTQYQPPQSHQNQPPPLPPPPPQPQSQPQPQSRPPNSRPPTQPPVSPPGTITATQTPTSPWSFTSHRGMNLPPPAAPSISDVETQSTITRGVRSPSISTQSTNLWLHSTGTGGDDRQSVVDMGRAESPLSLGLPSSLAFESVSASTARPEPHAFSFRAPSNNPNVFKMGTMEQTDEHRPFGSSLGFNSGSVQSAPSQHPQGSISSSTEMRTFDSNHFPPSLSQARFGTPGVQSPFGSMDRAGPFPSQVASAVSTIQLNRPPIPPNGNANGNGNGLSNGNGNGHANAQATPRSPRSHSRMSSYSSQSFPTASSHSPPTPQFASANTGPSPPISFHPLIRVLEKFRAQGLFAPLRSAVGSELRQSDPHVYDKLGGGIRTFKEYAGAAERSGLVALIGGSPGKEKISLVK